MGRRKGQVLVLVTVGIVFFMALLALVIEVGRVYHARGQLFDFCDAAALAGAQDLPATDVAKQTAIEYYARNLGASFDEINQVDESGNTTVYQIRADTIWVTSPYEDSETQRHGLPPENAIEVRACRRVPLFFVGLLGLKEAHPCGRAVGIKWGQAFAVFVGGAANQGLLRISGSHNTFEGDIFSNGRIWASGSFHEVTGTAYYVTNYRITGSHHQIEFKQSDPIDFPSLPRSLDWYRQQAIQNGTYYMNSFRFNRNNATLEGVIFVENGDIVITGSHLSGNVTFVAPNGVVRISGSRNSFETYDGQLLAYSGSWVHITGSRHSFKGIFYSEGDVDISGSHDEFEGGIAAKNNFRVTGSYHRFTPGFYQLGPGVKPVLFE